MALKVAHASDLSIGDPFPLWLFDLMVALEFSSRKTIITTNYDLLIEAAVLRCPRPPYLRHDFDVFDLYGVPVSVLGVPRTWQLTELDRPLSLLKLHGSLCWYWAGPADFSGDTVSAVPLPVTERGRRSGHQVNSVLPRVYRREVFLVPPTSGKTAYFTNGFTREVWGAARKALAESPVVYCLGYSMPEADITMRSLLAETTGKRVVVVDIDEETADRYRDAIPKADVVDTFCGQPDAIPAFAHEAGRIFGVDGTAEQLKPHASDSGFVTEGEEGGPQRPGTA